MLAKELLDCSFAAWYPKFAGVSVKSRLIPLPEALVQGLLGEVKLPANSPALIQASAEDCELSVWSSDDSEGEDGGGSLAQQFPDVAEMIGRAIADLGGAVVPKLNWSCPQDAIWITTTRSLRCSNADEVLLLLSSSDRVAHDIEQGFAVEAEDSIGPPSFHLALRKFQHFRPGREFRCFVRHHELIGICQRDMTAHVPGLSQQEEELSEIMLEFYEQHIELRFPQSSYTFDVYVATDGRVRLVDFNPIGFTTQPLLFTWQELGYGAPEDGEGSMLGGTHDPARDAGRPAGAVSATGILFRLVQSEDSIRPASVLYGAPYDFVDQDVSSVAGELVARMRTSQAADETALL